MTVVYEVHHNWATVEKIDSYDAALDRVEQLEKEIVETPEFSEIILRECFIGLSSEDGEIIKRTYKKVKNG